jgi:OHCU decarboxylase
MGGKEAFVRRYGDIYEHSPWVAERCFTAAAAVSQPTDLARLFRQCVDDASAPEQLALIRTHPDLAGKAAIGGTLTAASTDEQASAGIDQCSTAEFERFQRLNAEYREKFGFPFVMAVRGSNRHEILAAFAARLDNSYETEFANAIDEIHKIARLRLEALETS